MKEAVVGEKTVTAGPDAPKEARCPVCGGRVVLRRRGQTRYYRHADGEGPECSRRFTPWRWECTD